MSNRRALSAVTALFFTWGFLTSLNDVLVPHLRSTFGLSYRLGTLIPVIFFTTCFVFAYPSSRLIELIGYKRTMVVGLATMSAGAFLFVPASAAGAFIFFLPALAVLAAGITILQAAAGPYVSLLGSEETASSRFSLALGFNSVGTLLSLPFGSWLILTSTFPDSNVIARLEPSAQRAYRIAAASTVRMPYLFLSLALLSLAIIASFLRLPRIRVEPAHSDRPIEQPMRRLLHEKQLVFGAIAMFIYVGAEISIGSFLVDYLSQPVVAGMTKKVAALYGTFFWGGAAIGRLSGWAILRRWQPSFVLSVAALSAASLVSISILTGGLAATWSILAVGLFNSVMVPIIFNLGIRGLGELTAKGSGVMVAAIVGGAVIPLLQGMLADSVGLHHAFVLPVICYLYIAGYALQNMKNNEIRIFTDN